MDKQGRQYDMDCDQPLLYYANSNGKARQRQVMKVLGDEQGRMLVVCDGVCGVYVVWLYVVDASQKNIL